MQHLTEKQNTFFEDIQTKTFKIAELEAEIMDFEYSMKNYEDNEIQLRNLVASREEDLIEQQQRFEEAGNPDFDNLVKLEVCMIKELDQIGKTIKESILKEIHENNKEIEKKINKVMNQSVPYSTSVEGGSELRENSTTVKVTSPHKPVDLRSIMIETKNDQMAEVNDQKVRACNFIIHGVPEDSTSDNVTSKTDS